MKNNYNDCLNRVLKYEGGYSNNPADPGGPTNFGITLIDYRKYINSKGTATDVKSMSVDQAKAIYKSKYWDALGCDDLLSGVDFTVFDYGVNSGLKRPQNDLKRFSNLSGVQLINAINDERMSFLRSLPIWGTFGNGWSKRVADVRSHSIELATASNHTAGAASATAAGGLGVTLSQYFHNHETAILIATIAVVISVASLVHYYRNKK